MPLVGRTPATWMNQGTKRRLGGWRWRVLQKTPFGRFFCFFLFFSFKDFKVWRFFKVWSSFCLKKRRKRCSIAPRPWCHQGFIEVVLSRFHICLSNGCCFRKFLFGVFRRSGNCSLHLSPSLVLGSKLHELLSYTSNPAENEPCRCCWGILWVYLSGSFFFGSIAPKQNSWQKW